MFTARENNNCETGIFDLDAAYVVFVYVVMPQTFNNKRHFSRYSVATGSYGRCIAPGAATVTSPWRCCFTEYAQTWWDTGYANSRPSRVANPLIIGRISMQFVAFPREITTCVWFDTVVGWVESLGVFNKLSDFGPRTPYQANGSAGDAMRVWVNNSLSDRLICHFKASLLLF